MRKGARGKDRERVPFNCQKIDTLKFLECKLGQLLETSAHTNAHGQTQREREKRREKHEKREQRTLNYCQVK